MGLRRQFLQFFVLVSVTVAAQKAAPKSFQDPKNNAVDNVNPWSCVAVFMSHQPYCSVQSHREWR